MSFLIGAAVAYKYMKKKKAKEAAHLADVNHPHHDGMAPAFRDSGRYESIHRDPHGPGDARPTAEQIIRNEYLVGKWHDKVILVTGGSNGIGVEEVRALALTGAQVIFTSRTAAKGRKVRDEIVNSWVDKEVPPRIEAIELDLESLESVKRAAKEFQAKHHTLNILINNAGIGLRPFGHTHDGFEKHFGVNHLAHFYLFLLLKPLLLNSSTRAFQSRVISVSSSIIQMGSVHMEDYNFKHTEYSPFAAYASSKTANIWMANEIERRYASQGLHSISVHPGGIMTGFMDEQEASAKAMVSAMIQQEHIAKSMKSIEQGAASVVLAAVGKEYEGAGGFYMEDCSISPLLHDDAPLGAPGYKPWVYNEEGERRLWKDSLKMLKLSDDH